MKRLVLPLLFCSSLLGGIEYPQVIGTYLQGVVFKEQEQHDRVERALLYLEGMDQEDLKVVATYLWVVLLRNIPLEEDDCGCDCCCDVVEIVNEEFATCCPENCC